MNYLKKQNLDRPYSMFRSSWIIYTILFLVLSGFGSTPVPGELSLEFGKENGSNKVTFTKWRFVHYYFPNGKLSKLKFTALVRPRYYIMENEQVSKKMETTLNEMGSQDIIMEVYDAEKVGKNQYQAKAFIEVNEVRVEGTFHFKPSNKGHLSFEGRFETNGHKLDKGYRKHDLNFDFKAYIPNKS